ncbi:LysE family translocator [Bosea vestrisii]|uniref:LysE family translocator n=1 Tax=Bosea vestrisii TaxID=151416 RepID=A0ABW0HAH3_9HYPH
MTVTTLLAYSATLLLAVATPGPAMFGVISTGLARGTRAAIAVGLGVALGDIVLVGVALLGLSVLASAFGWVFMTIKYVGAAYLVLIGVRMWRAAPDAITTVSAQARPLRRSTELGAAMALGNPKAILFHASLMPLLLDLASLTLADVAVVLSIVFTINMTTMGAYAALSGRASGWFRTPGRQRWINRVAGGALVSTGAVIAVR